MEAILHFATVVSPIGIIALLVIVILQLINGKGLLTGIRSTQVKKYNVIDKDHVTLETLNAKINKIADNHLHELPEMRADIKDIKDIVGRMDKEYSNRLTAVEAELKYSKK